MINITNKVDCCGCNACEDVCPKKAISFKTDVEGFWYPEVDTDLCIKCDLCNKICPVINNTKVKHNDYKKPLCYASINKDIEVRFDSTSGGIFSALAEKTYKEKGYVGGAIFEEDFSVKHIVSSDRKDLLKLRSSKYLQSNAIGFYKKVKLLLKNGEKVLVCGTPCQIAALKLYLQKDYDNLILVDFICRGINSPKVFRKYLDYLEERYNSKVVYFKAKNKELGWRKLTSKVVFKNKATLYDTWDSSYFTAGYLQTNVYSRPSCYDCKFKGFPRIADITIADYWGAEKSVGSEMDNDLGTSLVMLNSQKGKNYFESIQTHLLSKEISLESTIDGNRALLSPLAQPLVNRTEFYKDLDQRPFLEVAKKYIKRHDDIQITQKGKIKNIIKFFVSIFRVSGMSIPTFYKNIKYNFFYPNIKTSLGLGHHILIYKNCILNINKNAKVIIEGSFSIGKKTFPKSRIETRFSVGDNAVFKVGKGDSYILYGSDIEVFKGAQMIINGDFGTNINTTIICANKIQIGTGTKIGRDVTIRDNNGNHFMSINGYKNSKELLIGQHCWLCEGCTLLSGTKLGDGVIIGAKSVVTSHIPSHSLVFGNPAEIIDRDIYWKY